MKLEWLFNILKELEESKYHGKVIINMCAGDVPSIEKQERINKPEQKLTDADMVAISQHGYARWEKKFKVANPEKGKES